MLTEGARVDYDESFDERKGKPRAERVTGGIQVRLFSFFQGAFQTILQRSLLLAAIPPPPPPRLPLPPRQRIRFDRAKPCEV
jgi:hypothetical protein